MVDHASPPTVEAHMPTGAQFVTREVQTASGPRRYKLFIPSGYHGSSPVSLVVVLHGCTQDPDNVARGTRFNDAAEKTGALVVYPEQPAAANGLKCWNWFNVSHQKRDAGEPALIAAMTHDVMATMKVDSRRVYIVGLSAGGAMAMTVAYAYPELYAAAGIHSGIAYGIVGSTPEAIRRMGVGAADPVDLAAAVVNGVGHNKPIPTIVFQGRSDKTVNVANTDNIVAQLLSGFSKADKKNPRVETGTTAQGYHFTLRLFGHRVVVEEWVVDELGHAWSGGSPDGTYTDPRGPDATAEMMRFFHQHVHG